MPITPKKPVKNKPGKASGTRGSAPVQLPAANFTVFCLSSGETINEVWLQSDVPIVWDGIPNLHVAGVKPTSIRFVGTKQAIITYNGAVNGKTYEIVALQSWAMTFQGGGVTPQKGTLVLAP